jgi:hypothetical protein
MIQDKEQGRDNPRREANFGRVAKAKAVALKV